MNLIQEILGSNLIDACPHRLTQKTVNGRTSSGRYMTNEREKLKYLSPYTTREGASLHHFQHTHENQGVLQSLEEININK